MVVSLSALLVKHRTFGESGCDGDHDVEVWAIARVSKAMPYISWLMEGDPYGLTTSADKARHS
ncbi:hypothetical protein OAL32_00660 [Synechococcus sp. AH-551-G15]|nr:hypothetical protein [Synechococcus sp. AH-551-G15]